MQNHILVFLNSFAVFLSICNLVLLGFLMYRQKDKNLQSLFLFFVFFFCYGFVMLVMNYTLYIVASPFIRSSIDALITILFVLMYGQWVNHLIQRGSGNQDRYRKILLAICLVCIAFWGIDSLLFVDSGLNVLNRIGSQVTTIMECAAFVLMLCFCARMLKKSPYGWYEVIQTILMLALFLRASISDVQLSFFGYNVQDFMQSGIMTGDWLILILFCLLTNVIGLANMAARFTALIREAQTMEDENQSIQMTLQEFADLYQISRRELDVVELIYKGKNNQEIAEELFISQNTVKKHINSIFRKTEAESRAALIAKIRLKNE